MNVPEGHTLCTISPQDAVKYCKTAEQMAIALTKQLNLLMDRKEYSIAEVAIIGRLIMTMFEKNQAFFWDKDPELGPENYRVLIEVADKISRDMIKVLPKPRNL